MSILVVEDNYLVGEMMRLAVEEADFEVIGPVSTLDEGVKRAQLPSLDGAFLDINLGGHQSFPLARLLKANRVPIIFVSGYGTTVLPQDMQNETLISKPILASEVTRITRESFQANGEAPRKKDATGKRAEVIRQRITEGERRLVTQRRRVEKLQFEGYDPQALQLAWDLYEQMAVALRTMLQIEQSLERSNDSPRDSMLPPISDAMINANDPRSVEHWASEFRITPAQLRNLVGQFGPSSRLVAKALARDTMLGPPRKSKAID